MAAVIISQRNRNIGIEVCHETESRGQLLAGWRLSIDDCEFCGGQAAEERDGTDAGSGASWIVCSTETYDEEETFLEWLVGWGDDDFVERLRLRLVV
jgi:ribosome modulation factor